MVVNEFDIIRKNISAYMIQIPEKIAPIADMWTNIISFTKHHIEVNIATSINNVLNNFNLQEKTLALITDNESAMLVCGRTLEQQLILQLNF
ncbi:hypothetical protein C1646_775495 [Rhizophagus diaphanus]|nr:hypothetical protein C1646_775495 [Rhizophagus diaphanus] [Rhizophagus sp. MUCL 43196]